MESGAKACKGERKAQSVACGRVECCGPVASSPAAFPPSFALLPFRPALAVASRVDRSPRCAGSPAASSSPSFVSLDPRSMTALQPTARRRATLQLLLLWALAAIAGSYVLAAALGTQGVLEPAAAAASAAASPSAADTLAWDSPPVPLRFQEDAASASPSAAAAAANDASSLSVDELSASSILSSTSFVPPVPSFPLRFRAKARFLVGAKSTASMGAEGDDADAPSATESVFARASRAMSITPSLLLLHFDGVAGLLREDFYALISGVHRRFFSGIRDFTQQREWLVYHKQRKSPRACFEVPFSSTVSALFSSPGFSEVTQEWIQPSSLQNWAASLEYQGLATVVLMGEQGEASGSAVNMTLLHYKTPNALVDRGATAARSAAEAARARSQPPLLSSAAPPVHVYLHPLTHQPLVVSSPHVRIDILSFQTIDDEEAVGRMQAVFDVKRASKAKCLPFTPERN